ncbi:hypothetical protein CF319_g9295, partial [Tilletia indica]
DLPALSQTAERGSTGRLTNGFIAILESNVASTVSIVTRTVTKIVLDLPTPRFRQDRDEALVSMPAQLGYSRSKSPAVKISDPSVLSTQSSVNTKLEEANLSKTSLADSTLPKTSNETIRTASASSTLRSSTFATGALAKKRTIAQVVDTEETARPATRSRIETEENRRLESSAVEMSSTPTDPTTLNHGPGHCSSQNTMSNSPAEDDLDSLARNLLIAEVHKKQGVAPARVAWVQRIFEDNRTLAPVLARALCISLEHLDQILKQPLTQDQRSLAHQLNILCAGCARVPAQVLCTGCQVIYKRYDLFHFRDPDEGGIGGGGGRFQRV